jgi:predicted DNA-binding transcriptional regulator
LKTNKHQTLTFIKSKGNVRAQDIVNEFGYSSGTARSYLSYLARHGLLERNVTGYILSEKGKARLEHFEASFCGSFDCLLCYAKKEKHFTCPRCQYQLPKEKARIKPEWNFLIGVRHSGVYCPMCQKLIFNEKQARLLSIRMEEKE